MKKHNLLVLLVFIGLFSCQNKNFKSKEITEAIQINSIQKEETEKVEETDFDKFFKKYSPNAVFQINQ